MITDITGATTLAQISSYSRLVQDFTALALRALHPSQTALEALASAAREVHRQAALGEAGDVVGLLVALGRAEEALAPLLELPEAAQDSLGELREALGLTAVPARR